MLAKNVKLQNQCGVDSKIFSPHDIKRLVPDINLEGIICGSFNEKDGVLFPIPRPVGLCRQSRKTRSKDSDLY